MRVRGPTATIAARFIDRLWEYVCANVERKTSIGFASSTGGCLRPAALSAGWARDGLAILAVGRMGAGITRTFANQSELARDFVLGAARHEIQNLQQDLGFGTPLWQWSSKAALSGPGVDNCIFEDVMRPL